MDYGSRLISSVKNDSMWEKLDNMQCIKEYGRELLSTRGDVLAVSDALNDSYSIKHTDRSTPNNEQTSTYGWMCYQYPEALYG